jgi:hypothetical protein
MRNVGAVNSPAGNPQPPLAGPGRAGGTAKKPSKPPFVTFTNEGK